MIQDREDSHDIEWWQKKNKNPHNLHETDTPISNDGVQQCKKLKQRLEWLEFFKILVQN